MSPSISNFARGRLMEELTNGETAINLLPQPPHPISPVITIMG
ncbi:MAG: hypothetical protein WC447_03560 [Candidatus Paceibacterota bacterium]